ncbi:hypothetical protein EMIT043CA1_70088 [Pseudomonas brassicacearum]
MTMLSRATPLRRNEAGDSGVGAFVALEKCAACQRRIQPVDHKAFMPMARGLRSLAARVTRSTA